MSHDEIEAHRQFDQRRIMTAKSYARAGATFTLLGLFFAGYYIPYGTLKDEEVILAATYDNVPVTAHYSVEAIIFTGISFLMASLCAYWAIQEKKQSR